MSDVKGFYTCFGVLIAIACSLSTYIVMDNHWRSEVIERGFAEYKVDSKGNVIFEWKGEL